MPGTNSALTLTEASEAELESCLARFHPSLAQLLRGARSKLRSLLPPSVEKLQDRKDGLAIEFAPSDAAPAFASITAHARWVTLRFASELNLPDPTSRLQRRGSRVLGIRIESMSTFDAPDVRALIAAAAERSRESFGNGTIQNAPAPHG